jgi:hypothetical protein
MFLYVQTDSRRKKHTLAEQEVFKMTDFPVFLSSLLQRSSETNTIMIVLLLLLLLLFYRFFPKVYHSYYLALEELKLHTLRMRRHHLDALSFIRLYLGSKFCPSVLEIAGLRVPSRYMFIVCSSSKNCPARCASAANVVCRNVDLFGIKHVLLNHIL